MTNAEQHDATRQQSESVAATSLDREEVIALAGAGAILVGTLLPAVQLGQGDDLSFFSYAESATILLWSLAASVMWSVTRRRVQETTTPSLLILGSLLVFGSFVWLEELREETRSILGTWQGQFRPASWCVVAGGAIIILLAGFRSRSVSRASQTLQVDTNGFRAYGATIAILGCLLGLAFVNPFNPEASLKIRQIWYPYADEIRMLRLLVLGGAAFAVVSFWQEPRSSLRWAPGLIFLCIILIADGGFVLLSLEIRQAMPMSLVAGVAWSIFSITVWLNRSLGHPVARWKMLVIASPFIVLSATLLVSGELGDLVFLLCPQAAIAVGFLLCTRINQSHVTVVATGLVFGLPAAFVALTGADLTFTNTLGMSEAEVRFGGVAICYLLGWSAFRSLQLAQDK